MVATKQFSYTPAEKDQVHRFLLEKANSRRKLILNQQELAAEYGMEKTRFHRMVAAMVEEGRLRIISTGGRGGRHSTTVIVAEL